MSLTGFITHDSEILHFFQFLQIQLETNFVKKTIFIIFINTLTLNK